MSQIDKPQGAVKASEISTDNPVDIAGAPEREDFLTIIERLRRIASDAVMNSGLLLISDSVINWSTGTISMSPSSKLITRIIGAPSGFSSSTISLEFTADAVLGQSWAIGADEILAIEVSRSILESGGVIALTDGVSPNIGLVGQRIVKMQLNSLPVCQDPNNGSPEGTLYIPLCARPYAGTNLWWSLSGIQWSEGTSSFLGQAVTENTIPIGGVIAFHRNGDVSLAGTTSGTVDQAFINTQAPGFWLCDGSLINNPNSPLDGFTTPNLIGQFARGHTRSNQSSGSSSVTLVSANLPSHSHNTNQHGHYHGIFANITPLDGGNGGGTSSNKARLGKDSFKTNPKTDVQNEIHTHSSIDTYSYTSGGSPVTVNGSVHENQPQWYNVIFLMRVI